MTKCGSCPPAGSECFARSYSHFVLISRLRQFSISIPHSFFNWLRLVCRAERVDFQLPYGGVILGAFVGQQSSLGIIGYASAPRQVARPSYPGVRNLHLWICRLRQGVSDSFYLSYFLWRLHKNLHLHLALRSRRFLIPVKAHAPILSERQVCFPY
jgi:hypothetical protein